MIDEPGTELETGPFLVIPTRRAGPYEWADAFSTITTEPAVKANSFSLITYNVLAPLNGKYVNSAALRIISHQRLL
jgi:hypothetical protein